MKLLNKLKQSIQKWLEIDPTLGKPGFEAVYYKGELMTEQPKGRVVKATARPEYTPDTKRHGGRVVKQMPRQLRKIKEGQESNGEG